MFLNDQKNFIIQLVLLIQQHLNATEVVIQTHHQWNAIEINRSQS